MLNPGLDRNDQEPAQMPDPPTDRQEDFILQTDLSLRTMIENQPTEKLSYTQRIDHIRTLRNSLIKDFLDEANLIRYFAEQYRHMHLNTRKLEFIKKELRELLDAPVDLVHYASLLLEMKQEGTASITASHHKLFYDELEKIFSRYAH
ncbi:MAG: hypothetical protein KF846_08630 [Cyclobacteriaceae bacterium]|nr:hypothetical protein [Cyclobacteriaceae bacterium]